MMRKSQSVIRLWILMDRNKLSGRFQGDIQLFNGVYGLICNSFCNKADSALKIDEPITTTESPELPNWVKFSKNENPTPENSDDDFVLPSISYWVENQKFHHHKDDVKSTVIDKTDKNVEILSKILRNRFQSPDSVLQALNGCGVNLSEELVERILKRFSSDWVPAFGFFNWAKLQKDFMHSPDLYNLMVDNLGRSKKFDVMWELVKEMYQIKGYITLDTMAKIMRRLAKAGKYDDAIDAFRRIKEFGLNMNSASMNLLLDALVKGNSVEHAQIVYFEFKNQITPNLLTFNVLLHGWCKARQLDKARNIVQEMKTHGLNPDVISYTCFVEAYCNNKNFRKVDEILEEMHKRGCPPNKVTYTIVMHALGKGKEINEALKVYEKMKQNGCVPDSSFYGSMIHILSKSGRLKDAYNVFEDMTKQGVNQDVLTYNTMITSACHHLQEENALNLLRKMEEDCIKPDLNTYAPLLKMCCKLKRMRVLAFLLSHMFKNDVSVELGTYSLLIRGLCKSGKFEHACSFFEEAVLRGFVPRDCMYEMLVTELEKNSMSEAKEQIEKLMVRVKEEESS